MNVFSLKHERHIILYVITDIDTDINQQQDLKGNTGITRITYSSIPPLVCNSNDFKSVKEI